MVQSFNLQFCEKYGYPAEVHDHLKNILACLNQARVLSVLLIGSTCRGELGFIRRADGQLCLLSDYEFFVVVDGPINDEDMARSTEALKNLELRLGGGSPLFHIDVSWIKLSELQRLPPKFQIFEAKTCGVPLVG